MRRFLFAAAALASIGLAAPMLSASATAQPYPPTDVAPGQDIRGQLDALRLRVKTGFDQGVLGQGETSRLYRELDKIAAIEQSDRDSNGQLREHDRTELQGRIDSLSRSIQWRSAEAAPPPPAPVDVAPPPVAGWSLGQREDWLQGRIDRGVDQGRLSGNEARRGESEMQAIRAEQARLTDRDGGALSAEDRSYLLHRVDELNQTLRWSGRNPPAPWMGM